MDLKNTYLHKRNTSVKVDGRVYQIDEYGIAAGVDPQDARKLLCDKRAWQILRQPAKAEEPVAVPPVPEPVKVPTEPMVEPPAPMPGPGPELIPTGAAEAALAPEKPVEPAVEEKAPEPTPPAKNGPGRPRKR